MNLVGYVRVSTREQLEGLGLEVQETALRTWAEREGHTLLAVTRDEGISGSKDELDRPGLAAAIAMVEDGGAEGIVVYRLDRLARDLILQETIISRLAKLERKVLSTQEDIDGDTATRVLIRQILGAISQYERALIAARMAAGRAAKHAKGGYGYGAPGLGMRAENRELVPDVDEQRTIRRMVELAAGGASLRQIASTLTNEGHRPKRGDRWHPQSIRRTLGRLTPPDPLEPTQEVATA